MLEIVLLIRCIGELSRYSRLKSLSVDRYVHVQPEAFFAWQDAQLRASLAWIMAFPGEFVIALVLYAVVGPGKGVLGDTVLFLVLDLVQFSVWVGIAAAKGSGARNLAREAKIVWS